MKFSEFICFDATVPQVQACDRDGVIAEIVNAIDKAGHLKKGNCKKVIKAIIERENEASTGMGKGIAIPHVKHSAVTNIVAAIGQCQAGIDFSALDKEPVYSVLLLISPANDPDKHLQAMETIFTHLQKEKFRKWLKQAETTKQIKDLLKDTDEELF